ncbi:MULTISPECIES: type II toxin-antitoxin system VapC family toxin [unclassified Moraxella]|uniref:type II toxin-antitoxin system VapC family toxin n=1 Tax=unclassified Moraxella TaxID=2685852 RepID=UPI003AF8F402
MNIQGKRLYFDTNPLIYFLERDENFYNRVEPYFEQLASNQIIGVASHLVIAELLVKPVRTKDSLLENTIKEFMLNNNYFEIVGHTQKSFSLATKIRAEKNLKMVDALHVATAIVNRCDCFLTYDEQIFNRINEIAVIQI